MESTKRREEMREDVQKTKKEEKATNEGKTKSIEQRMAEKSIQVISMIKIRTNLKVAVINILVEIQLIREVEFEANLVTITEIVNIANPVVKIPRRTVLINLAKKFELKRRK